MLGLGNGRVLVSGLAVLDLARLVRAGLDQGARRDGLVVPARLVMLRNVLTREARAAVAAWPDGASPAEADRAWWPRIDVRATCSTAEAARLLGRPVRTVRRLADRLGARKVGGRLRYDLAAVRAAVQDERDDDASTPAAEGTGADAVPVGARTGRGG